MSYLEMRFLIPQQVDGLLVVLDQSINIRLITGMSECMSESNRVNMTKYLGLIGVFVQHPCKEVAI